MKIYTKTGDKGETGIIGTRISKSSMVIKVIGSLDEFNASLGIIVSLLKGENMKSKTKDQEPGKTLLEIQNSLFDVGAILANGKSTRNFQDITKLLEKNIDSMDKKLPKLQNFILPGGILVASEIHLSRAICRRAERTLVEYIHSSSSSVVKPEVLIFINRLSDYLFVLARYVNFKLGYEDIIWNSKSKDT